MGVFHLANPASGGDLSLELPRARGVGPEALQVLSRRNPHFSNFVEIGRLRHPISNHTTLKSDFEKGDV